MHKTMVDRHVLSKNGECMCINVQFRKQENKYHVWKFCVFLITTRTLQDTKNLYLEITKKFKNGKCKLKVGLYS